jgi:hypothetical protein
LNCCLLICFCSHKQYLSFRCLYEILKLIFNQDNIRSQYFRVQIVNITLLQILCYIRTLKLRFALFLSVKQSSSKIFHLQSSTFIYRRVLIEHLLFLDKLKRLLRDSGIITWKNLIRGFSSMLKFKNFIL